MIDYYLKKHCLLRKKGKIRCGGCVWLDRKIKPHKCIFALDYPKEVSMAEFKSRIKSVEERQQTMLSNPKKRFVLTGQNSCDECGKAFKKLSDILIWEHGDKVCLKCFNERTEENNLRDVS